MMRKKVYMNYVTSNGGNKGQRKLCEDVANFMIGKLMPRMRTLDIEINLVKLTGDVVGWCQMNDTNREFTLEISKDMTIKELVTTICHEMIHVKQYARKEMTDDLVENGQAVWRGRKVNPNTKYYDLPWEREAYRLQDKFANLVWNEEII
tara:strand:+ start:2345 stop:2794 length:450 start_codon:yes stop_codon:yes gene_type:complete